MKFLHSLKFKLIAATLACVVLVSLLSSLFLYSYLNYAVDQKSERLQQLYLTTLQQQMDKYISDFCSLVVLAANDRQIGEAMAQHGSVNSVILNAQSRLGVYLRSCPGESYVDKFMAVAGDGRLIQAVTRQYGRPVDAENLFDSGIFRQAAEEGFRPPYLLMVGDSIQKEEPVLALLCPIRYSGMPDGTGFIYLELGLDLFTDLLEPYINVNNAFLLGPDGSFLSPRPAALPETFDAEALQSGVVRFGGERWRLESVSLAGGGMTLCTAAQLNVLDQDGMHAIFVVGVVFLTGLLLAGVLAFLLSTYLTRPVHRLNDRLKRIGANDFSRDPETERTRDEIGEIGRTVNEMAASIDHLLHETEEMYRQRQSIEIALLQSQVNPHFLYNTLDSIRWMALIQKCPGIANMLRSLVSLMKNIAKGTQDHIPLREELALLEDYITIQSVKYMEVFSFVNAIGPELGDYRIIKLTLQPLVENAIFHGIEPTGECGTITLSGREEGEDLLLCVEDDGAGIEPELLGALLTAEREHDRSSMNGIGLANVHKRLQLTYGERYGLSVESVLGEYTRVTVRLPKER